MSFVPVSGDQQFPKRLTIPKLKMLTGPGKLVFLAVQTKKIHLSPTQYKRVLVRGVAIYWRRERKRKPERREEYFFDNSYDFFEWLTGKINQRETLYLYSHDVTTDFLTLDGFRQLPIQDFSLQSIYHKLTTTIIKFSNGSRRLTLLDIQNYYPFSLDSLATSFKMAIRQEPQDIGDQQAGYEWCKDKTRLIETIMTQLIRETVGVGRGALRLTASGTAHAIYRASYMRHKIVTNHEPGVVAFEKSAYVGGYTGLHKLAVTGEPDLYKVDVNSMYPSVMYTHKFPTQLMEFAEGINLRQLERYLDGHSVIATLEIDARNPYYPVSQNGTNYYPKGRITTTLATQSLKRAMENDEIIKVHKVAIYLNEPIFSEFIVDNYNRRMQARQEGNTAHELLQKAISNTLYGKFGQMQTETIRVGDAPLDEFSVMDAFDPENNTSWLEMHAGGSILFIRRSNETRYTSFAIAAHITDYARQKLFQLWEQAGKGNVYYCDTDSLIVNRAGLHNLYPEINQTRIGLLKIESVSPFFIGFAKKDYVFGESHKRKGFSRDGKRVDENLFSMYQKVSVTGGMQKRLQDGAYWKQVNKHYNPFLEGVDIDQLGNVTPLVLPGDWDRLGMKKHTLSRVRDLVRYTFNDQHKSQVREWLGI